ncbi:hypothetical protein HanHA300_Chr01g0020241 [Helianthus annuus]|nr:hypothetical protein HanHA300_Chr01g0020241 [Helianthus annuus]KAJ0627187.1 hypothetical protein HanHA89_Chr01g0022441 [Helianthus annuus]
MSSVCKEKSGLQRWRWWWRSRGGGGGGAGVVVVAEQGWRWRWCQEEVNLFLEKLRSHLFPKKRLGRGKKHFSKKKKNTLQHLNLFPRLHGADRRGQEALLPKNKHHLSRVGTREKARGAVSVGHF